MAAARPGPVKQRAHAASGSAEVPRSFICPLTLEVMRDPVMDFDGTSYERAAIMKWLGSHWTSPVTRKPLASKHLVPNRALRDAIYQHMGHAWARRAEKELQTIPPENQAVAQEPPRHATNRGMDNRTLVDSYLEVISRTIHKDIRLNHQGIASFTYGGAALTFVIEAPRTVKSFFVYVTLLGRHEYDAHVTVVRQRVLEMNYLQQATRGGCLALDPLTNAIVLSYTDRPHELNATDFRNVLENFIDIALKLRQDLSEAIAGTS